MEISEELVGFMIRELRELRGISRVELAKRLGISRAQLAQIELGYYVPSIKVLVRILGELDARLELVTDEGGSVDPSGSDRPPAPETG